MRRSFLIVGVRHFELYDPAGMSVALADCLNIAVYTCAILYARLHHPELTEIPLWEVDEYGQAHKSAGYLPVR